MLNKTVDGLMVTAATAVVVFGAAEASERNVVAFDLPAQPLLDALRIVGERTDTNILVDGELVLDRRAPALHAQLTAGEALTRLLSGSGLQFEFIDERTIVLTSEDAEMPDRQSGSSSSLSRSTFSLGALLLTLLHPFTTATADTEKDGELSEIVVTGRRIDSTSMMKRGETLRETPQSVTIMTQQRIEEQKLVSVSDVLAQAPGITVEVDTFGQPSQYYSRGFAITNVQIDGASVDASSSYYFNPNLAMYEQVEVLRGADGLFAGNGDPSGTVNLARKRASANPKILLDVSAGSWNDYSAQLDAGGPIALDGRIRARAVARWHDKEFFYDTANDRGKIFYATVEGDLTDRSVLIAGGSYEEGTKKPWPAGMPRLKSGASVPLSRSRSLMADWSNWESQGQEAFLKLEHQFNSNWQLVASATHGESEVHLLAGYLIGLGPDSTTGIDPNDPRARIVAQAYDYDSERNVFDVTLQGKFELFGRQHTVMVGADRQKLDNISMPLYRSWNGSTLGPLLDIYDFDDSQIPYPDVVYRAARGINMIRQQSVYGKLQLQVLDPLRLIVGGRYFDYDYYRPFENYNAAGAVTGTGATGFKDTGIFNPYYGVLFDLNEQWTLYGSLTEIYRSQATYLAGPLPGTTLDPMTGRNYELGTKADLRGGRLNVSFALYRTERTGEAEQDYNYPQTNGGAYTGNCCYFALGEVVSQGIDAELSGEILPGWSLSAGYTLNENENKRSGVTYLSLAPKHLFKLWSTYRVPAWQRLTLGAGLTTQTSRYVTGTVRAYDAGTGQYTGPATSFEFTQGGYTVVNALAQYEIDPTWSVSVNANNLLDKVYYSALGGLAGYNHYGQPRSVMLTVRGRF